LSFHVLGAADPADRLHGLENVEISGEYREEEVFDRLEDLGCHCALFPSVWPESYCYTLSIAQAGGFYAIGFDLGAQGARIREHGWGQVLPLNTRPSQINDLLLRVRELLEKSNHGPPVRFAHYDQLLRDYYGLPDLGVAPRSNLVAAPAGQQISAPGRHARAALSGGIPAHALLYQHRSELFTQGARSGNKHQENTSRCYISCDLERSASGASSL
jgi:hypothetical protein